MDTSIEDRKKEFAFNLELDAKVKSHQTKLDGEFIEDVLIRVSKGGGDRVCIINRLPKNLLYVAEKHMMPVGDAQYLKPSGEVWSKVLPGIEHAKEDNSFIFFEYNREGKEKLDAIDRYIESKWPNNKPLPKREYYAMQPGVNSSPAKPRSMILRVDLPTSPPAAAVTLTTPFISRNSLFAPGAAIIVSSALPSLAVADPVRTTPAEISIPIVILPLFILF